MRPMFPSRRHRAARLARLIVLLGLLALAGAPVVEVAAGPARALPPHARYAGRSHAEWSMEWWRFVFRIPPAQNPLNDPTGDNCAVGQSGHVWFLVGTATPDPVVRTCRVPTGTALFFPVVNTLSAVPEDGATAAAVRAASVAIVDEAATDPARLYVTVDGEPVADVAARRVTTPVFAFTGATPNVYSQIGCVAHAPHCYEGLRSTAVADGYYVLLPPLPKGEHTLRIHGEFPAFNNFVADATYHLIVG